MKSRNQIKFRKKPERPRPFASKNSGGSKSIGEVVTGNLKMHADGYGFLIPEKMGVTDVFIPARFMGYALPNDTISAIVTNEKEGGRREGRVHQIIKHGKTHWVGTLIRRGRQFEVLNNDFAVELVIGLDNEDLKDAHEGDMVSVRITHYPGPGQPMMGVIEQALGSPREESTLVNAILVAHGISRDFPQAMLSEAEKLSGEISPSELKTRVDLQSLPFVTIDGITARDFDDAVCAQIKGEFLHLWVAIADVAHYVTKGSLIDQEAVRRGTSVYLPDQAIPMLPEKLSNDLCSLRPGEPKRVLVCEMKFDSSFEMREAHYYEAAILSQRRTTYEEVQAYIDKPGSSEKMPVEVKKSLDLLKALALGLIRAREKRGSIDFDLPEARVVYDHAGKTKTIVRSQRFFSHRLIEECMIAANVAVATLFMRQNIPLLYRVHDKPDLMKLTDFFNFISTMKIKKISPQKMRRPKDFSIFLKTLKDNPFETLIHHLLLRSMKMAIYDADNRGHFGLSLENYAHFTSPIRRYPDLLVHRQLKSLLGKSQRHRISWAGRPIKTDKKSFYSFEELKRLGEQSSRRERDAMESEREVMDLKRTLFMQDHLGEKYFGTVTRVVKFGMFVDLGDPFVEGLLHVRDLNDDYYEFDDKRMELVGRRRKGRVYRVGDQINVVVADVSISDRKILLRLA